MPCDSKHGYTAIKKQLTTEKKKQKHLAGLTDRYKLLKEENIAYKAQRKYRGVV